MKLFRGWSLSARLVALFSVLLVAIGVFMVVFFPARMEDEARDATERRVASIGNVVATALGPAIEFEDEENAASILGWLSSTSDARFAVVRHGKDTRPFAQWHPEAIPQGQVWPEPSRIVFTDELLVATVPIHSRSGVEGTLHMGFSLEELVAQRDAAQRTVAIAAAIVLSIGVLATMTLAALVVRPIRSLTHTALGISRGELPPELPMVEGATEVARMGEALRSMLARLNQAMDLEVARRTQIEEQKTQLVDINEQLAAERRRLEKEFEIAANLQTSILPADSTWPGGESAAKMVTATEAGGDYYDIIPSADGCWIGIGDVAGHGLRSAVVMTMVQSMVSMLVRHAGPRLTPRDVVISLNRAIHENVFRRLRTRDHVTFSLLHCEKDGRVVFAGAHEIMVVYRADRGVCEYVDTPGMWIGPAKDVAHSTANHELVLGPGDVLALYTDGLTEARNASGEQYGLERFAAVIQRAGTAPLAEMCDRVVADARQWMHEQEDDLTVLLYRRAA